jgi:hypothetical protein
MYGLHLNRLCRICRGLSGVAAIASATTWRGGRIRGVDLKIVDWNGAPGETRTHDL